MHSKTETAHVENKVNDFVDPSIRNVQLLTYKLFKINFYFHKC